MRFGAITGPHQRVRAERQKVITIQKALGQKIEALEERKEAAAAEIQRLLHVNNQAKSEITELEKSSKKAKATTKTKAATRVAGIEEGIASLKSQTDKAKQRHKEKAEAKKAKNERRLCLTEGKAIQAELNTLQASLLDVERQKEIALLGVAEAADRLTTARAEAAKADAEVKAAEEKATRDRRDLVKMNCRELLRVVTPIMGLLVPGDEPAPSAASEQTEIDARNLVVPPPGFGLEPGFETQQGLLDGNDLQEVPETDAAASWDAGCAALQREPPWMASADCSTLHAAILDQEETALLLEASSPSWGRSPRSPLDASMLAHGTREDIPDSGFRPDGLLKDTFRQAPLNASSTGPAGTTFGLSHLPPPGAFWDYEAGEAPNPLSPEVYPSWWPQSPPTTPEALKPVDLPRETPPKRSFVTFASGPHAGCTFDGDLEALADGSFSGEGEMYCPVGRITLVGSWVEGLEQGPGRIIHEAGGVQNVVWHKGVIIDVVQTTGGNASVFPLASPAWGCTDSVCGWHEGCLLETKAAEPEPTPPETTAAEMNPAPTAAATTRAPKQSNKNGITKKGQQHKFSAAKQKKPAVKATATKPPKVVAGRRAMNHWAHGDWECSQCEAHNFKRNVVCIDCSASSASGHRYNEYQ